MANKSILFVCLGNICRSPSAEGVMKHIITNNKTKHTYHIDSAGIIGVHAGEKADSRMRQHAAQRKYDLTSISRQIQTFDFEEFDYIIGMDNQNIKDLQLKSPTQFISKIYKMTDFCTHITAAEVPDPYYGGAAGFELVLDILEDACQGLFQKIEMED